MTKQNKIKGEDAFILKSPLSKQFGRTGAILLAAMFCVTAVNMAYANDDVAEKKEKHDVAEKKEKHDVAEKKEKRDHDKLKAKGIVVTGFNRLFGEPVMKHGVLGELGFTTIAAHNPNESNPVPLTDDSSESTLLVTDVDPEFINSFTGADPYVVDPTSLNVPLRDVPVNADPTGIGYVPLKGILETEPLSTFAPGQREPSWPITLDKWFEAKGKATIKCIQSKYLHSVVELKMHGLIPNRIYTVWGFYQPESTSFPMQDFGPIRPLGGVQNAFVTNEYGNGSFKRVLNFCPTQLGQGEIPLGSIFVMFQSGQHISGGVPSFAGQSRFPGTTGHVHLQFPVSAELIKQTHD